MMATRTIRSFQISSFKNLHKMNSFYYRCIFLIFGFWPILSIIGQTEDEMSIQKDSTERIHFIIEGDTIARDIIDLDEVFLIRKLEFKTESDRRNYLILRRKTLKVYPYAKLAAERLTIMNERLSTLEKNSDKRKYTRIIQKYLEGEFTDTLKNMTRSEGQILVKLIHRQTGYSAFDLIKEFRTGWKAFWSNITANMFDISLKEEYRPFEVKEDYLIEDILQRSFQENKIEPQAPSFPIDWSKLNAHWTQKVDDN